MKNKDDAPYIIVTPSYLRTSAGVRALHILADALNRKGCMAYVTCSGRRPDLITPELRPEDVERINGVGVNPIVVYPEVKHGNAMEAAVVVRYLLNYPGFLGGDKELNPNEFIISWSKGMNYLAQGNEFLLYIPVVDTTVFYPPKENSIRKGSCFYWGKYKYYFRGKLEHAYPESQEIHRFGPSLQEPVEIAEMFRRSEVFYCYENSMLSLEAALCGCPVVLIPNEHFEKVICSEWGMDGMAWGDFPDEIARAKATVANVQKTYDRFLNDFYSKLDQFIYNTQRLAHHRPFQPIRYYRSYELPSVRYKRMVMFLLFLPYLLAVGKWQTFGALAWRLMNRDLKGFQDHVRIALNLEKRAFLWAGKETGELRTPT